MAFAFFNLKNEMENIEGKFANAKKYNVDDTGQAIIITDSLVKKIPVLGQVYSVGQTFQTLLDKQWPGVFSDMGQDITKEQISFFKTQPTFYIWFKDKKFTQPVTKSNGLVDLGLLEKDVLDNKFTPLLGIKSGIATIPDSRGDYILFPNILSKAISDAQITQDQANILMGQSTSSSDSNALTGLSSHNLVLIVAAIILLIILMTA